jgi:hypothetical protein
VEGQVCQSALLELELEDTVAWLLRFGAGVGLRNMTGELEVYSILPSTLEDV